MEQLGLQVVATICLLSLDPQLAIGIRAARTHATSEGVLVMEGVPAEVASWLAATPTAADPGRSAPSLRTVRGELPLHTAMMCDLNWPDDGPRYYLQKEGDDLYRRIQLMDREGYSVELRLVGEAPDLRAEVTARRREFTKSVYDETVRALVGRPDLLKTLCTTTAPVVPGETTIVVWIQPAPFAAAPLIGDLDARMAEIERAQRTIRHLAAPTAAGGAAGGLGGGEVLGGGGLRGGGAGLGGGGLGGGGLGGGGVLGGGGLGGGGLVGGSLGGGLAGELAGSSPTGIAIILSAEPRGDSAAAPVPDGATDAEVVQLEVACKIIDLVAGTPPWKQVTDAADVAAKLSELLDQGTLHPQNEPRVCTVNNSCATISFETVWQSEASAAPSKEEVGLRPKPLGVGSRLSFTPRILEDGRISLAVEAEFSDFAGWIIGQEGKRLPVMGTHRTTAHLVTANGEPTVMSVFLATPKRGEEGQTRSVQAIQRMLLITPHVLNPEALPKEVQQKLKTPDSATPAP